MIEIKLKSNLELMRTLVGIEREGKGYTKQELAEISGVHPNYLAKIEKSKSLDTKQIGSLLKLAFALDIDLLKTESSERYLLEVEITNNTQG